MQGVSLERGQITGSAGAPRSRFVSPCMHRSWHDLDPPALHWSFIGILLISFWAGAIVWYSTHLCLTTSPISCTASYWSSPSQPRSSPGPSGSPGCSSPSPSPAQTWAASRASPATSRASSGRTSWCTTCPPPSTTAPRSSRRTRPSCSATRRPTSRRQRGSSCRPFRATRPGWWAGSRRAPRWSSTTPTETSACEFHTSCHLRPHSTPVLSRTDRAVCACMAWMLVHNNMFVPHTPSSTGGAFVHAAG